MNSPFSVVSEHLSLFAKLYPQYKGLIANWQEDLEDTRTIRGVAPAQRVFRAIREGYTLQSEICLRADVTPDLLEEMLDAEVLTTLDQGGKTDGARGARKKIFSIAVPKIKAAINLRNSRRTNARPLAAG